MEQRKEIKGFQNYWIYSDGRIQNKKSNKFRKKVLDRDGYSVINFTIKNKYYRFFVHKLVFEHFVRPLQKNEDIHHINHIRDDNRVQNLMAIDNIQHNRKHKLGKHDSQETKRKKSQKLKNKKWTVEDIEKREQTKKLKRLENPNYGKPLEETKQQMYKNRKKVPHPNQGKHLSQQTKRKKSQAMKKFYQQHPNFFKERWEKIRQKKLQEK